MLGGWTWYAADIAVPTLWEAASKAGMVVGSVSWPVSVAAQGIRYNVPEYWRAPKFPGEDVKLLRAISTPGLIAELEKEAGPYITDIDDAVNGDRQRTRYAVSILRHKHPQFMTVHLAALDHIEHGSGPFSAEANSTLEQVDAEVGELEDAARAAFPNVTVCVLSDHGFARTEHAFNLVSALAEEGLVTMSNGKVADWKAYPDLEGGSAAVLLKDPKDEATRAKLGKLLQRLAADSKNGIAQILNPDQIAKFGGRPDAAFWVDMKSNFAVTATDKPKTANGSHGYAPSNPQLLASFFIAGPKVKSGVDLGEVDMRSIAATLAKAMNVPFPSADLPALPVF